MKRAIGCVSLLIGAALLLAAPAAWAKDPAPGATRQLEEVKDAPDAESGRKKGGKGPVHDVPCKKSWQTHSRFELGDDGKCYRVMMCHMATTPFEPCEYKEWECDKRPEEQTLCGPKNEDEEFLGNDWDDQHGIE